MKIVVALAFLLIGGIAVDQHMKLMRSMATTDRCIATTEHAISVAAEWKRRAESNSR